jgi:hypothetical protein
MLSRRFLEAPQLNHIRRDRESRGHFTHPALPQGRAGWLLLSWNWHGADPDGATRSWSPVRQPQSRPPSSVPRNPSPVPRSRHPPLCRSCALEVSSGRARPVRTGMVTWFFGARDYQGHVILVGYVMLSGSRGPEGVACAGDALRFRSAVRCVFGPRCVAFSVCKSRTAECCVFGPLQRPGPSRAPLECSLGA